MTAQMQLEADLKAQGFDAEAVTSEGGQLFVVLRGFTITSGAFENRVIEIGLEVPPDYPHSLASALHIKADPKLLPAGIQPTGYKYNVIDSSLGPLWQYWSFNLSDMWRGGRGSSLASIINGVMERA